MKMLKMKHERAPCSVCKTGYRFPCQTLTDLPSLIPINLALPFSLREFQGSFASHPPATQTISIRDLRIYLRLSDAGSASREASSRRAGTLSDVTKRERRIGIDGKKETREKASRGGSNEGMSLEE